MNFNPVRRIILRIKPLLPVKWFKMVPGPAIILLCWFVSPDTTASPAYQHGFESERPVNIYYFYFTPRCDECIILGNGLRLILSEHYAREIDSGKLVFKEINLTDPDEDEKEIIKKLRVRRQLLLLVTEENTLNLTRDAFRFVERDFERFVRTMREAMDEALAQ